ncbi:MAG: hypothetical protein WCN27_05860, partial [Alphaproteobacteria bacterium]
YCSLGSMTFIYLIIFLSILIATGLKLPQASRVLDATAFAVFSIGVVLTGIIQGVAIYLRAHKQELLTVVGVLAGLLYGASAWFSCMKFGFLGIAVSYTTVTTMFVLPFTLFILKSNYGRLQS